MSLPTEVEQRLSTVDTHKDMLSNKGGNFTQSTRESRSDLVGFLEAHRAHRGSIVWLLNGVSSWYWSTTFWLYWMLNLPFKEVIRLTRILDFRTKSAFMNDLLSFSYFINEETD